jgi:cytochrome c
MKIVFMGLIFSLISGLARADGDAAQGQMIFKKCGQCHIIERPENKTGPSLMGVVGRPAASFPGYAYSAAMSAKGAEGWVWTEDNIAAYLLDPKGLIPGVAMNFAGLKKPQDIADVIAYLKAHPKP